jgi:hypothetical protein
MHGIGTVLGTVYDESVINRRRRSTARRLRTLVRARRVLQTIVDGSRDPYEGYRELYGMYVDSSGLLKELKPLFHLPGIYPDGPIQVNDEFRRTVIAAAEDRLTGNPSLPELDLDSTELVTLYRPVGPKELALIEASGWKEFPPRLPEQPIFYPVTNEEYAKKIARDWNVRESGSGFVTRFQIRAEFAARYPVKQAGGAIHTELWVPAEELPEFNRNVVGLIEVIAEFH